MITLGKTVMGATAATALAVAAPAQARDHDGGIDGEDILTGALVIGGIAAIAAAASSDDDRYDRYDRDWDRRADRRHYGDRRFTRARMGPRAAVNRCTAAVERRASRRHGRADVTRITEVDRDRNGWEIEGRLVVDETRYGRRGWNNGRRWDAGYRDLDRGRFSCRIRYGQIDRLRIRGID